MFELQKQKAKLVKMLPKIVKRTGDKEPEGLVSLVFEATMGNEVLSELHPTLRSFLFIQDENTEDLIDKDALTKLRFGQSIKRFKWEEGIEGADVSIAYGVSGDVHLESAKVSGPTVDLQPGGSINVSFAITGKITGAEVGKTFDHLLGNEVEITIGKPQSNQTELDV